MEVNSQRCWMKRWVTLETLFFLTYVCGKEQSQLHSFIRLLPEPLDIIPSDGCSDGFDCGGR